MPSSSTSFSCTRCAQPSHSWYNRSRSSASMRILSLRTRSGISPFCSRMDRTVLRLIRRRRAISCRLMPSWWSKNTALRLSASIMEFPHAVGKRSRPAQNSGGQQMSLCIKGWGLQPPVFAFAHHPLHVLLRDLQVFEQHPFKLVAAVRVLRHLPHPFQGQPDATVENRFAKRLRPAKVALGQLFDLAHTELLPAHGHHEVLNLLLLHPVHTHERSQRVHVGINRKLPLKICSRTSGLISAISPSRMLTQDLLRDSCWAISATLICSSFRSSSRNRACSRMLRDLLLEIRSRFRMAVASSPPREA